MSFVHPPQPVPQQSQQQQQQQQQRRRSSSGSGDVAELMRKLAVAEQSKSQAVMELQMKLTQSNATISTLQSTTRVQLEATNALRNELANVRQEKTKAVMKVKTMEKEMAKKDKLIRELSSELEDKKAHVVELAGELRAVEEELIVRRSGRCASIDDDSMPSLTQDSISLQKKKREKKKASECLEPITDQ